MIEKIIISGFADEIDPQLDVQLKVVKSRKRRTQKSPLFLGSNKIS